jgi:anti-anti-sigma factor
MKITENVKGDVTRIFLKGRFDANTCGAVEEFIRERMGNGSRFFVLDMKDVTFIASAGLRVILVIARELRQEYQGDVYISTLTSPVNKVFEISGLNNVIKIFEDTETATQYFPVTGETNRM